MARVLVQEEVTIQEEGTVQEEEEDMVLLQVLHLAQHTPQLRLCTLLHPHLPTFTTRCLIRRSWVEVTQVWLVDMDTTSRVMGHACPHLGGVHRVVMRPLSLTIMEVMADMEMIADTNPQPHPRSLIIIL